MTDAGALVFGRYAYPPNAMGYCGPDAPDALLEQVAARVVDGALSEAARGFEGAWPYLELIAHCSGSADPLDPEVVEAYWLGNALLDRVTLRALGDSCEERFRPRVGAAWDDLVAGVVNGARPHHNFHVLGVYPWLGLIRAGAVEEPLTVLDGCRIRWGQVLAVEGDEALVWSSPLVWHDGVLTLGSSRAERARLALSGQSLAPSVEVGGWVALHWDWVCDSLTPTQLRSLREETRRALAAVNGTPRPAPAAVLS